MVIVMVTFIIYGPSISYMTSKQDFCLLITIDNIMWVQLKFSVVRVRRVLCVLRTRNKWNKMKPLLLICMANPASKKLNIELSTVYDIST